MDRRSGSYRIRDANAAAILLIVALAFWSAAYLWIEDLSVRDGNDGGYHIRRPHVSEPLSELSRQLEETPATPMASAAEEGTEITADGAGPQPESPTSLIESPNAAHQGPQPSNQQRSIFVKWNIVYKTVNGIDLRLDMHYPGSSEPAPGSSHFPIIIYTHGGGYCAGDKILHGKMGDALRELVRAGFVVASIEYRLLGKAKAYGGNVLVGDCVSDAKDAVHFLSKHHDELCIDIERVFFFGDSAGGHIAQTLLLSPPSALGGDDELSGYGYTPVAGVSWYGPVDFQRDRLFNGSRRFKHRVVNKNVGEEKKLEAVRKVSPVNYLTKDSPPLLLIHGDRDTTIPVHHALFMKEQADEIGANVELFVVTNAGHNFRSKDKVPIVPSKKEIVRRTVEYFAKFLA